MTSPSETQPQEAQVLFTCPCGSQFTRVESLVSKYDEIKDEFPSAASFFKRKLTYCDTCIDLKIRNALGALDKSIRSLTK